MKLLCITEPKTHPEFDTTVELYRRFAVHPQIQFYHTPCQCIPSSGEILTVLLDTALPYSQFLTLNDRAKQRSNITDFDLVFDRSDKPLPTGFLESLAQFEAQVSFVNRPSSIKSMRGRDFLQAVAPRLLPDFTFTRDTREATEFLSRHAIIVAKKNVSYGGKHVYKIWFEGSSAYLDSISSGIQKFENSIKLFEHLFALDSEPYQLVRFLKNVPAGDKRVLVIEREILGGYIRKSQSGNWIHNITSGGKGIASSVDQREREIILATQEHYTSRGINTLGYDFLMDDDGSWILSEINVGNVGGYDRLEQLSGMPIIERLCSWLLNLHKFGKFADKSK